MKSNFQTNYPNNNVIPKDLFLSYIKTITLISIEIRKYILLNFTGNCWDFPKHASVVWLYNDFITISHYQFLKYKSKYGEDFLYIRVRCWIDEEIKKSPLPVHSYLIKVWRQYEIRGPLLPLLLTSNFLCCTHFSQKISLTKRKVKESNELKTSSNYTSSPENMQDSVLRIHDVVITTPYILQQWEAAHQTTWHGLRRPAREHYPFTVVCLIKSSGCLESRVYFR